MIHCDEPKNSRFDLKRTSLSDVHVIHGELDWVASANSRQS